MNGTTPVNNCTLALTGSGAAVDASVEPNALINYNTDPQTGWLYRRNAIDTSYYYEADTTESDAGVISNKTYGLANMTFTIDEMYSPQTSYHRKAFGLVIGQDISVINNVDNTAAIHQYFNGTDVDGSFLGLYKENDTNNYLKISMLGRNRYQTVNTDHPSYFLTDRYIRYKKAYGGHAIGDIVSYNDLADKSFIIQATISQSLTDATKVDVVFSLYNSNICPSTTSLCKWLFKDLNPSMVTGYAGFGALCTSQESTSEKHHANRLYSTINTFSITTTGPYAFAHPSSSVGTPITYIDNGLTYCYGISIVCPSYAAYLRNDCSTAKYSNVNALPDALILTGHNPSSYWYLRDARDPNKSLYNTTGNVSLHTIDTSNDLFYISLSIGASDIIDEVQQIIFTSSRRLYYNYSTEKFVLGSRDIRPENCTEDIQVMVYKPDICLRTNFGNDFDIESTDNTLLHTWHWQNDFSCVDCDWYDDAKAAITTWGDVAISYFQNCYYFNSTHDNSGAVHGHSLVERYEEWARINGDGASPYSLSKSSNSFHFEEKSNLNYTLIAIAASSTIGAFVAILMFAKYKTKKQ